MRHFLSPPPARDGFPAKRETSGGWGWRSGRPSLPGADLTAWAAACPTCTWRVEELILMESRRDEGGLRYIPLSHRPMGK